MAFCREGSKITYEYFLWLETCFANESKTFFMIIFAHIHSVSERRLDKALLSFSIPSLIRDFTVPSER